MRRSKRARRAANATCTEKRASDSTWHSRFLFWAFGLLALQGSPLPQTAQASTRQSGTPTRHIVLLAGYMGWAGQFDELKARLRQEGFLVTTMALKGRGMFSSIEELAHDLEENVQKLGPVPRMTFVAHSLGGIVVRQYLKQRESGPRIDSVVMLGCPNHGTKLSPDFGKEYPIASSQLNPSSDYMKQYARTPLPRGVRFFSLWDLRDRVIRPSISSVLDGAYNIMLSTDSWFPHANLPASEEVMQDVEAILKYNPPPSRGPQGWTPQLQRWLEEQVSILTPASSYTNVPLRPGRRLRLDSP
jgi:pimeloyl-ACP methyl ester carboxylesterase